MNTIVQTKQTSNGLQFIKPNIYKLACHTSYISFFFHRAKMYRFPSK